MRLLKVSLLFIIVTVVAACQPQAVPTLAPTVLPPTFTPGSTSTDAPPSTALIRATLPATWTPIVLPSDTPTPYYTPFAVLGVVASPTCADFGEDFTRNSTTFSLGTAPQVFWRPLPGAAGYRIILYGANGEMLFDGITAETSFTFDAALFTRLAVYSWEVIPIDGNRVQPCPSSGNVLIASVQ